MLATALFCVGAGVGYAKEQPVDEGMLQNEEQLNSGEAVLTTQEVITQQAQPITVAFDTYVNGKIYSRFQSYFGKELTAIETEKGYQITLLMQHTDQIATLTINGITPIKKDNEWTYHVKSLTDIAAGEMTVTNGQTRHLYQFDIQLHVPGKQEYVKAPFKDIEGYENEYIIGYLFRKGIFTGATAFNPNHSISKSQFARTVTRAFPFNASKATVPFTDLTKLSNEAREALILLWQNGAMQAKTNTLLAPTEGVTRRQAALTLYRVLQLQGVALASATNPYKDIEAREEALIRSATGLHQLDIMTGSDGQFKPNNVLTRHQMAKVLYRTLLVIENQ